MPTLFEKIIAREIPAEIVHEDALCIAFYDIDPQAPVHILIVPVKPIPRIEEADADDQALLGHLLLTARSIAVEKGLLAAKDSGFRIVINNGACAGESVPHLHVHLLAGRPMKWPPG